MSSRKRKQSKQLTSARWKDFTKEVEHRGKKVKVSLPKEAVCSKTTVMCDVCQKEFLNTQGLGTHKLKCEKTNRNSSNIPMLPVPPSTLSTSPPKALSFVEKDVRQVLTSVVEKAVKSVDKKPTKQRGASRRESHTVSFKAKVLKELLYTDKSQYTVAEIFKDKNKIFQQAAVATKKIFSNNARLENICHCMNVCSKCLRKHGKRAFMSTGCGVGRVTSTVMSMNRTLL